MNRRLSRVLVALLPLLLLCAALLDPRGPATSAAPAGAPFPDSARKLEPALRKQLLQTKGGRVPFVAHFSARASLVPATTGGRAPRAASVVSALQIAADRAQVNARALLAARQTSGQAGPPRVLWIANALAGEADRDTILALAALSEVSVVRADHVRQLVDGVLTAADDAPPAAPAAASAAEWNLQLIGADRVWSAFGIDGSGVVIANLDTGVDWQHPALQTRYRGYRGSGPAVHTGNWFDATGSGYLYPGDGYGHGTHTMGTLVGGAPGDTIGVAPGAKWIAAKIFDNSGRGLDSWIHAGFQWVIAPGGDPALAPDIVSNSWGTDNGFDTVFQDDVRAVRAAGIVQVFSNGNNGVMGLGTVGAPASYPESFGVGATDSADQVAYFSSRGPSPIDGHIKPDVSAPGVGVRSSVPGGGYQLMSGTSMAAPHVAGLAALLRQAQPSLTVDGTYYLITSTALPLTTSVPNNNTGWGRVDAFQAVLQATAYGTLSGTITAEGAPLAGAQIVATDRLSRTATASSGPDGVYRLPLAPGDYWVSVFAYGFAPALNNALAITTAQATTLDATLLRLPSGVVRGRLTDVASSQPISASVQASGTPATTTAGADGFYTLTLPVGDYTLRTSAWAHRALTATVSLTANALLTVDFALASAPTILLVDSGAWYMGSQIQYYRDALDALGYPYAVHAIGDPLHGAPATTTLQAYDIVVWSAPFDSPDYIGAGQTLIEYFNYGGRMLLSGQDIAFWDAGPGFAGYDYFPYRLHGQFAADAVATTHVAGISGEALQGITFTLNTTDSAHNQGSTDAVQPLDATARPLARYATGDIAGLVVDTCVPYRAAYLSFGFEGAGPAATRQAALQQLINWLTAAPAVHGLSVTDDASIAVGVPGATVTHAVSVRNTGIVSDAFDLALSGQAWPTALWSGGAPLGSPLTLGACEIRALELRTTIPTDAARNTSDQAQLAVQAQGDPSVAQTRTVTSKTPAPLLLVDDDRWYEQEQKYTATLAAAGIAYDVFDTRGGPGPSTATMQMYPLVVWFTGYDWFDPLSANDEAVLAAYLNAGGRLFFTSQDYLDVRYGQSSFAPSYLGVLSYTNDVTVTSVGGARYSPIADGLGPYTLTFPFNNFSDYVLPTVTATAAYLGNGAQPSAVTVRQPNGVWKTAYFAFPFETLPVAARPVVLGRVAGWLGPLGDSAVIAPSSVLTGAAFTYQLSLTTSNAAFGAGARVTVTLPASVTLLSLGDPSLAYDAPSRSIRWSGMVTAAPPLTWTVQLDPAAADPFYAQYEVADVDEGFVLVRRAWTFVERAKLYLPLIRQ
ncbi:MAG: S8 family serine peptidase [Chloroflexi bacterium]|nr:S8 family serine peptidase [Chloroflexota bacterium]